MKIFSTIFKSLEEVLTAFLLILPVNVRGAEKEASQVREVVGIISDGNGDPIIGAAITIKGNRDVGAVSDIDGRYSIKASEEDVLVFTCIGFETVEAAVRGQSRINVVMPADYEVLDETVVIAYGSVKKRDMTGSVSSLKSDDLLKTNPVSVNQGLQGKMAGVQVSQSDGAPGAGINIQVRGANSFTTSTEPLYVVDGMPYSMGAGSQTDYGMKQTNNPLSTISPQDIYSIEVLKDASATAIYGSRAANGVVIITTKSGEKGRAKVLFSANTSISKAIRTIDVLDACDYAKYRNERQINGWIYDGRPEEEPDYPEEGYWRDVRDPDPVTGEMVVVGKEFVPSPEDFRKGFDLHGKMFYGTNWQDEIFQTAFSQDYNVTVSGGDDKGSYMYSGGYTDQQGVIVNSFYKRYTARANNNRKINKFLELGANISFASSDNRFARTNSETFGVIPAAISFSPVRPVFDPKADSGFSEDFSTGLANPYLTVHTEKNIQTTRNVYISSYADVKFTDWLKFRQNFGTGLSYYERNTYCNRWTGAGISPRNGYATKSDDTYESMTTESLLQFDKTFGAHGVNAILGMTYEDYKWHGKWMTASNFPNDINEDNNMEAGINDRRITSSRGKSQLMSFLFRTNYSLSGRYLFTFSARRDGSSRLSPMYRWNNFYSGAFAWRISDEPWVKNLNFFNDLKLRLSFGQTGNQGVSAYATRSRFVASNYLEDGALSAGMAEDRWGGPAAPLLKWETTDQADLGLDMSVFNNRFNLTVDLYYKKTFDLLLQKLIPMSSGFKRIPANYGNVTNRGLEISGNFIPVKTRDFLWTIDANISFNRNKVGGLDGDQYSDVAWGIENVFLVRNGEPIGTLYGFVEDGFYDNEAEVRADPQYRDESDEKVKSMVGEIKYKNFDEDPVIDNHDRQIIGNTNPDFQYGLTSTLEWKNFTFSFFLQGTHGNDILNVNLQPFNMRSVDNVPYFVYNNRWTPENRENARWPRATEALTRAMKASDRLVEDGSYLRCKNMSLGYRFNHPFKYVSTISLTASVSNLFTISKYSWMDPDVNSFGSDPQRRGVDMASYPSARTFNFSIQAGF